MNKAKILVLFGLVNIVGILARPSEDRKQIKYYKNKHGIDRKIPQQNLLDNVFNGRNVGVHSQGNKSDASSSSTSKVLDNFQRDDGESTAPTSSDSKHQKSNIKSVQTWDDFQRDVDKSTTLTSSEHQKSKIKSTQTLDDFRNDFNNRRRKRVPVYDPHAVHTLFPQRFITQSQEIFQSTITSRQDMKVSQVKLIPHGVSETILKVSVDASSTTVPLVVDTKHSAINKENIHTTQKFLPELKTFSGEPQERSVLGSSLEGLDHTRDSRASLDSGISRDSHIPQISGVSRNLEMSQDSSIILDSGLSRESGIFRDSRTLHSSDKSVGNNKENFSKLASTQTRNVAITTTRFSTTKTPWSLVSATKTLSSSPHAQTIIAASHSLGHANMGTSLNSVNNTNNSNRIWLEKNINLTIMNGSRMNGMSITPSLSVSTDNGISQSLASSQSTPILSSLESFWNTQSYRTLSITTRMESSSSSTAANLSTSSSSSLDGDRSVMLSSYEGSSSPTQNGASVSSSSMNEPLSTVTAGSQSSSSPSSSKLSSSASSVLSSSSPPSIAQASSSSSSSLKLSSSASSVSSTSSPSSIAQASSSLPSSSKLSSSASSVSSSSSPSSSKPSSSASIPDTSELSRSVISFSKSFNTTMSSNDQHHSSSRIPSRSSSSSSLSALNTLSPTLRVKPTIGTTSSWSSTLLHGSVEATPAFSSRRTSSVSSSSLCTSNTLSSTWPSSTLIQESVNTLPTSSLLSPRKTQGTLSLLPSSSSSSENMISSSLSSSSSFASSPSSSSSSSSLLSATLLSSFSSPLSSSSSTKTIPSSSLSLPSSSSLSLSASTLLLLTPSSSLPWSSSTSSSSSSSSLSTSSSLPSSSLSTSSSLPSSSLSTSSSLPSSIVIPLLPSSSMSSSPILSSLQLQPSSSPSSSSSSSFLSVPSSLSSSSFLSVPSSSSSSSSSFLSVPSSSSLSSSSLLSPKASFQFLSTKASSSISSSTTTTSLPSVSWQPPTASAITSPTSSSTFSEINILPSSSSVVRNVRPSLSTSKEHTSNNVSLPSTPAKHTGHSESTIPDVVTTTVAAKGKPAQYSQTGGNDKTADVMIKTTRSKTKPRTTKTTMPLYISPSPTTTQVFPAATAIADGNLSTTATTNDAAGTKNDSAHDKIVLFIIVATIPTILLLILIAVVLARRARVKESREPFFKIQVEYNDHDKPRRPRSSNSRLDLTINGMQIDVEYDSSPDKRASRLSTASFVADPEHVRELHKLSQECKENLVRIHEMLEREFEPAVYDENESSSQSHKSELACSNDRDSVYSSCSELEKGSHEPSEKDLKGSSSSGKDIQDKGEISRDCFLGNDFGNFIDSVFNSNDEEEEEVEIFPVKNQKPIIPPKPSTLKIKKDLPTNDKPKPITRSKKQTENQEITDNDTKDQHMSLKKPPVPRKRINLLRDSTKNEEKPTIIRKRPEVPKKVVGKDNFSSDKRTKPPVPKKPEGLIIKITKRAPKNEEGKRQSAVKVKRTSKNTPCENV